MSSSSAAASTGIWADGLLQNKVAIVTGTQPSHAILPSLSCTRQIRCHPNPVTQKSVQAPTPVVNKDGAHTADRCHTACT